MTSYRYPSEQTILFLTVTALLLAGVISAGISVCLLPLLVGGFILLSYWMNQSQHRALVQRASQVTPEGAPRLYAAIQQCQRRLRVGAVSVFVAPQNVLNAYTFGFDSPKVMVLYNGLFQVMDEDELRFIIGHELGHVALGHAWLNTLLGGMAGVPVGFSGAVIMILAFRWWNRACEYSADRAGLLACGSPQKAVSALVKLVAGGVQTPAEFQRALAAIEQEDDSVFNVLAESLSTHPMIVRRIAEIRRYAASDAYRRLQARVNQM